MLSILKFNPLSIRSLFLRMLLVSTLLCIMVSIGAYYFYQTQKNELSFNQMVHLRVQGRIVANQIAIWFSGFDDHGIKLAKRELLKLFISESDDIAQSKFIDEHANERLNEQSENLKYFLSTMADQLDLAKIILINSEGKNLLTASASTNTIAIQEHDQNLLKQALYKNIPSVALPVKLEQNRNGNKSSPELVLRTVYPVIDTSEKNKPKVLGGIVFYIPISNYLENWNKLPPTPYRSKIVELVFKNLAQPEEGYELKILNFDSIQALNFTVPNAMNDFWPMRNYTLNEQSYNALAVEVPQAHLFWHVVCEIPANDFNKNLEELRSNIITYSLLTAITMLILFTMGWWICEGRLYTTMLKIIQNSSNKISINNALLESFNELIMDPIYFTNTKNKITYANKAFLDLLKREEDQVIQHELIDLTDFSTSNIHEQHNLNIYKNGNKISFESKWPELNKSINIIKLPVKDNNNNNIILGIITILSIKQ